MRLRREWIRGLNRYSPGEWKFDILPCVQVMLTNTKYPGYKPQRELRILLGWGFWWREVRLSMA